MIDFDIILLKLKNKEYMSINEIKDNKIEESGLKSNYYISFNNFIDEMCLAYPNEKYPKLFKDNDFVKSLTTSFRIIKYIENNEFLANNYCFQKCENTSNPLVRGLCYLNKGSMMFISDSKTSKINFSYCRKGIEKGMPSITGECKITSYDENTKEILDALFSIGDQ